MREHAAHMPVRALDRPVSFAADHHGKHAGFLGRWFEIARLPTPFGGTDVTIEFDPRPHSVVKLTLVKRLWGHEFERTYAALVLNPHVNTKLCFGRWVGGDLWILATDCRTYAMAGSPSRHRLYLYARIPYLHDDRFGELCRIARGMGYSTTQLVRTKHHEIVEPVPYFGDVFIMEEDEDDDA